MKIKKKDFTRPGATGEAFRSRAPPNENCALSSEDCPPKKVRGSMPLECSSRPETLKILVTTPEFVSKNCFFADFAINTHFFVVPPWKSWKFIHFFEMKTFFFSVFTQEFVEIRPKKLCFLVHTLEFGALNFLCSPKICLCLPSHAILAPGLNITKFNGLFQIFCQ